MKSLKTPVTYVDDKKEEEMEIEKALKLTGLTKKFKTKQKEAGLLGSFRALFKSTIKEVTAVDNISFEISYRK